MADSAVTTQAVLRAPPQPQGGAPHVLFDHFWVEAGDQPLPDQETLSQGFVTTPSVRAHLRSLARAALVRRYPVLLQVRGQLYCCLSCHMQGCLHAVHLCMLSWSRWLQWDACSGQSLFPLC